MRLHDPETGLPGRLLALDRIGVAAARSERMSTAVAVLALDASAEPAARVARLADALRAGDTVARVAGDELALVAEDLRDATEAEQLALRVAILLGPGAAVGLAVAEPGRRDPERLLREALVALARAREQGGGCELFDDGVRERALARARTETELRRAIAAGELVLHYQPIVDLEQGSLRGVEALVRWNHPEHGLLEPEQFVPVAAESGAIVPLGGWVLRDACRQAAAWHARRTEELQFWLSVNLSGRELAHPAIAGVVGGALAESGLEPSQLCLEVAEADVQAEPAAASRALRRLRTLGVRLALDDASADWSQRAGHLGVDVVKAGPRAVADVLAGAPEGVEVVATGVERRGQESAVRRHGGRLAQGFLYARPAPPAEIEALLELAGAPHSR